MKIAELVFDKEVSLNFLYEFSCGKCGGDHLWHIKKQCPGKVTLKISPRAVRFLIMQQKDLVPKEPTLPFSMENIEHLLPEEVVSKIKTFVSLMTLEKEKEKDGFRMRNFGFVPPSRKGPHKTLANLRCKFA